MSEIALNFLPLTPDLIKPLARLSVREDEAHLIAPNGPWMAQALLTPTSITFGVFSSGTAVALISLIDPRVDTPDDEPLVGDCIYVWRLMVDQAHRRSGIGARCIAFAQDYAQLVGLSGVTLTTMDKGAHNALPFYEKLGFTATGRRLHDEIELIAKSNQPPAPLAFVPPTFHTIKALSGLATAPHKSHLVLPALRILSQGKVSGENVTFGVFQDKVPVGVLSLDDPRVMHEPEDDPAADCIDIWQLMVDGAHEGQGHGTALVNFAKSYARLVGLHGVSLVTMDTAEHNARRFYEQQGFCATGRRLGGDLELIWRPSPGNRPERSPNAL